MNLLKTYKEGESLPDCWVLLCRKADQRIYRGYRYLLRVRLPWRVRLYTVNHDAWQLRHPYVSVSWWVISDSFTHQCTKEELETANRWLHP